jgi:16S rRNA (guanine527-N7)-methyltransferase
LHSRFSNHMSVNLGLGQVLYKHYFPHLSEVQLEQLERAAALYREWNERVNVISRKDTGELEVHHILHSLGIAKVVQFKPGSRVLDVGTGGGLPGIPLAILFPEVEFDLIDSIGKKIKVVNAIAGELGLKNVQGIQTRAEQVKRQYPYIVSRAVARLSTFYTWVQYRFTGSEENGGLYYLKGGELEEELQEAGLPHAIFSLSDYFEEPFFETKKVVYVP